MKSFKNFIVEDKTKAKRELRKTIVDWCKINIDGFDIEDTRYEWTDVGFKINLTQKIPEIYLDDDVLHIKTNDVSLPYIFCADELYVIEAPNLKSFDFKAFDTTNNQSIKFLNDNKLNYLELNYNYNTIMFENILKINPKDLQNKELYEIYFDCNNTNVHDFHNYTNTHIIKLSINQHHNFKNITSLLEQKTYIDKITLLGNKIVLDNISNGININIIINKYLVKTNKQEHVMDFTLEFLENGFDEDML